MTDLTYRYTYCVTWFKDDQEHVGLCTEFPRLSWREDTPETALSGTRNLVSKCTQEMLTQNEDVPEPLSAKKYSEKFMVRISPVAYRIVAIQVDKHGVSLNRLISSKLNY